MADLGFSLATGDLAAAHQHTWFLQQQGVVGAQRRLVRLRMEPWRRWSTGFSCLCFVLVGVPLAIRNKSHDTMTTFGKCFLPTLLLYYPLLMLALDRAKAGVWPPYVVWLPNIIMLLVGLWLIKKVERY